MASLLPLFPLNMVCFPNEPVNLHIFEPRYRQLINECWENDQTFGIPLYLDGKLMDIGTEMKVTELFEVYPDGEMDIKTLGIRPFVIEEFYKKIEGKLYSGGGVRYLEYENEPNFDLEVQLRSRLEQLFKLIGLKRSLDTIFSFDIAHYIGLTPKEEYQLLATPKEEDRQTLLINHVDRILPMIIRAQRIREKLQMNGHFKNLDILDF